MSTDDETRYVDISLADTWGRSLRKKEQCVCIALIEAIADEVDQLTPPKDVVNLDTWKMTKHLEIKALIYAKVRPCPLQDNCETFCSAIEEPRQLLLWEKPTQ